MRRPTGFSPAQYCRASASLTITTSGARSSSPATKEPAVPQRHADGLEVAGADLAMIRVVGERRIARPSLDRERARATPPLERDRRREAGRLDAWLLRESIEHTIIEVGAACVLGIAIERQHRAQREHALRQEPEVRIAHPVERLARGGPAPTKSTSVIATCTTTRVRRPLSPRVARPPDFNASPLLPTLVRSAGARPNSMAAPTAISRCRGERPSVELRPREEGHALAAPVVRETQTPSARARTPSTSPMPASARLSVNSCRTTLARDAPSAPRTANSCRLDAARASSRLARFAHAISSTTTIAAMSTANGRRAAPDNCSASGQATDRRVRQRSSFGYSRAWRAPMVSRFAATRTRSTPAFIRATTVRYRPPCVKLSRRERRRHPRAHVTLEKLELGAHDADDDVRDVVEEQLPPDDRGIAAKAALPEAVADDGDTLAAGPILVGGEDAPEHRLALQHGEEGRRHPARRDALRLSPPVEDGAVTGDSGNGFKHLVGGRPRGVGARPNRVTGKAGSGVLFEEQHEAIRGGKRQRPKQDGVEQAEHRGRAANGDTEREDGGEREARRSHERPLRILQVAAEILDPHERPCVSMCVPYGVETAETTPRRSSRLFGGHAAPLKLLFEQRQMRRHLPLELALRRSGANHVPQPEQQPS